MRPPAGLPPPVEFGLWKSERPRESVAARLQRGLSWRFPKGPAALAAAALLLAFLFGAAATSAFSHKPHAGETGKPTAPQVVVTVPTPPAPPPPRAASAKPADPPITQKPPSAAPSAKQLLIGRWQGRHRVPELGLMLHFVMTFEKDGTFSMQFAPPPGAPAAASSQGQRFSGVYRFRSPTVADFEWKTLPREIDVGVTTCTIRFVDRDLMILTSVLTGEKREFRRLKD